MSVTFCIRCKDSSGVGPASLFYLSVFADNGKPLLSMETLQVHLMEHAGVPPQDRACFITTFFCRSFDMFVECRTMEQFAVEALQDMRAKVEIVERKGTKATEECGWGSGDLLSAPSIAMFGVVPSRSKGNAADPNLVLRIYLVRHGESEANVDKTAYLRCGDHAISLTDNGKAMAKGAGEFLRGQFEQLFGKKKEHMHDNSVRMWVSPFLRTRQTAEEILKVLNPQPTEQEEAVKWVDSVRESCYLVEQDFGVMEGRGRPRPRQDFSSQLPHEELSRQEKVEELFRPVIERNEIRKKHMGEFWTRPPFGESSADVANRIVGFIAHVSNGMMDNPARPPIRTVIVVSHGNTLRAFISAWCRRSPEWFAKLHAPPNCSVQLIEGYSDCGFIFAGYQKGSLNRHPMEGLERAEDPLRERWAQYVDDPPV